MPSSILTSDVDAIMADAFFTSTVVFGAQSTRGVVEWADMIKQDNSGGEVFVRMRTLVIRTGTLTNVTNGASLVVDGVTYVVHDSGRKLVRSQFSPTDDGQLTEIVLVS